VTTSMQCRSCGGAVESDSRFCAHCGAPVLAPAAVEQPPAATAVAEPITTQVPPPSGNNKGLIIGLSAALLVAIAGGLVAVLLAAGGSDNTPTVNTPTVAAAVPTASVPEPAESNVTTVIKTEHAKAKKTSSSSVSSTTDKAEIRNVVHAHWADIERGSYNAAFRLLAPGSQSKSSWISAHESDALTSASISLGRPTITGSSATVPVLSLHTVADSGCFNWSGHYEMRKIGGSWRIGKAKISRSSC
jgi:hypothetical protein